MFTLNYDRKEHGKQQDRKHNAVIIGLQLIEETFEHLMSIYWKKEINSKFAPHAYKPSASFGTGQSAEIEATLAYKMSHGFGIFW